MVNGEYWKVTKNSKSFLFHSYKTVSQAHNAFLMQGDFCSFFRCFRFLSYFKLVYPLCIFVWIPCSLVSFVFCWKYFFFSFSLAFIWLGYSNAQSAMLQMLQMFSCSMFLSIKCFRPFLSFVFLSFHFILYSILLIWSHERSPCLLPYLLTYLLSSFLSFLVVTFVRQLCLKY